MSHAPTGSSAEEVAAVRAELRAAATDTDFAKNAKRVAAEQVIGVRMGKVFDTAKAHAHLDIAGVEELLESPFYEERMVAVSVMDAQARSRRTPPERLGANYELYLRRHDRIDTWDLVDRAAPRVVGAHLLDRPRDVLHELARSDDVHRRRTAMVACFWLIRAGVLDDPLAIAEHLVDDEPSIQSTVGTALREIGRVDSARRDAFLERWGDRLSAAARRTATTP